jgi:hypothetical protein
MKYLIIILIPVYCFGQVKDVKLENNTLYKLVGKDWQQAGSVIGGAGSAQTLIYDSIWGSYYSIGSGVVGHPGQFNVGIGVGTFENATTAHYNIHIGQRAGWQTTVGHDNIYIGWESGRQNTSGSNNVGIAGEDALRDNTTGFNNVAIGRGSMISNTTGRYNTATGYNALQANLIGEGNTAFGAYSMALHVNGSNNTALGYYSLETNSEVAVNNSIGIGYQAGIGNTYSNAILIGTNVSTTKNGGINIGGVYKGDITTGVAEVNSITISGRTITFDDNFMYVKTSTGVTKKVALQDIAAPVQKIIGVKTYNSQGQLLFYQPVYQ